MIYASVGKLKPTDLMTDVLGLGTPKMTAGVDKFSDVFSSALENLAVGEAGLISGDFLGLSGIEETSGFDQIKALGSAYLNKVNDTQLYAEGLAKDYALGENVEVHQVVIAAQEASLALQLTVQIQNKLVEAYQEIMRMQV
jgi:flagellar hook-basal body complex protein FliE